MIDPHSDFNWQLVGNSNMCALHRYTLDYSPIGYRYLERIGNFTPLYHLLTKILIHIQRWHFLSTLLSVLALYVK